MRIEELWYQNFSFKDWEKKLLKDIQNTGKIDVKKDLPVFDNDLWLKPLKAKMYLSNLNSNNNIPDISVFLYYNQDTIFARIKDNIRELNVSYIQRVENFKRKFIDLCIRNYFAIAEYEDGLNLEKVELIDCLAEKTKISKINWDRVFKNNFFSENVNLMNIAINKYKAPFYKATCEILNKNGIIVEY